jgi:hypothetical protein
MQPEDPDQRTWEMLGQWSVDPPAPDAFEQRVLQAAATQRGLTLRRIQWTQYVTRVAAAVVIASGVGVASALLIPRPAPHVRQPEIPPEQVANALGLEALTGDSAATVTHLFETAPSDAVEEEPL